MIVESRVCAPKRSTVLSNATATATTTRAVDREKGVPQSRCACTFRLIAGHQTMQPQPRNQWLWTGASLRVGARADRCPRYDLR